MALSFKRLPNATRLAAFMLVASLGGAVVSVRAARAQVHEGMRRLARQLMPYAEQGVMQSPRRVRLNGETLLLSVGTARDGVPAVLDWYERQCAARAGQLSEGVHDRVRRGIDALDAADFNAQWTGGGRATQAMEVLRAGDEQEGYVACIDTGSTERLTGEALLARARRMLDTGDLAHLGGLRYAYVTRGSAGTRIVTFATEGRFNLLRMFPAEGDAPGEDIATLARYPQMRRIVSASEEGDANGLGIYTVRAPMADVKGFYRREMTRRGWQALDLPTDRPLPPEVTAQRDRTQAFSRNEGMLYLVFDHAEGLTSMMALSAR